MHGLSWVKMLDWQPIGDYRETDFMDSKGYEFTIKTCSEKQVARARSGLKQSNHESLI